MRVPIVLLLLSTSSLLVAQPADNEWFYGFRAGATYSELEGIGTTIIPDYFPTETYETSDEAQLGAAVGIYFYHRFRRSRTAIQPEVTYAQQGGRFNYTDVEDLDYQIRFNYSYINLNALFKAYPAGGLHIAVGPQVGFNVGNTAIDYTSNMPELGPDLQITQSLREVLKGESNISVVLGLGYDFDVGLMVEARYQLGINDMMETLANGFGFIENKNRLTAYQLTLGWIIPFEGY